MIRSGCEGYDIHVICEFLDVFLKEILDLSPIRKIDFTTELVSGTTPICKTLYCKAMVELEDVGSAIAVNVKQRLCETKCVTMGCTDSCIDSFVEKKDKQ